MDVIEAKVEEYTGKDFEFDDYFNGDTFDFDSYYKTFKEGHYIDTCTLAKIVGLGIGTATGSAMLPGIFSIAGLNTVGSLVSGNSKSGGIA